MTTISLDFETRSTVDLRKTGVYPYAVHDTTDLWCMAWAIDDRDIQLWVPGDPINEELYNLLYSPDTQLRAWNATFERMIWKYILVPRYQFPDVTLDMWYDTMVEAALLGLPQSLKHCGDVLNIGDDAKDEGGRRLMLQMAKPRKPRKDEDPDALLWWDDAERRERLYEYCKQDVRAERAIAAKLAPLVAPGIPWADAERRNWLLDQEINERGVPVDLALVRRAREIADEGVARASAELVGLTDGAVKKPTAIRNMKQWLADEHDIDVDSLNKNAIRDMLADGDLPDDAHRMLEIRQDTGKSSVAKLDAMEYYACVDGRARFMLQFYGASPTGRWAGRGPQPQNMTRPSEYEHAEDCAKKADPKAACDCGGVERFIPYIMLGDYDGLEAQAPVVTAISDILRSCFKASEGCDLMGGDFSAIEMHVLAWLAGQEDSLAYEEMAGRIFGIDPASVTKDSDERMVGKVAILACGYQMGADKFIFTVWQWTGLDILEPEKCKACAYRAEHGWDGRNPHVHSGCTGDRSVSAYREAHAQIELLWGDAETAFLDAVSQPGMVFSAGRCKFMRAGAFMWIQLPSGRRMAYALPEIQMRSLPEPYEHITKPAATVCTMDSYTRRWVRRAMYGGLIVENMTQAIARDIMAYSMQMLNSCGYAIILTVHDEVLCEVEQGFSSVDQFERIMSITPPWAEGCNVTVEGWRGERYRK